MQRLPIWVLNHRYPSVYDSESKSAIEQTARVYGAMQDLIDEYNEFATATNKAIEMFEKDVCDSNSEFKKEICNIVENYIKSIDMRIDSFDRKVNEAIEYMTTKITETATELMGEAIEEGKITVGVVYNEQTESLDVVATGGV